MSRRPGGGSYRYNEQAVPDPVEEHHSQQHGEGEGEVDQRRQNRRDGSGQARKVDLGDQVPVGDQAVARGVERPGEELPGQQSTVGKNRIRKAVGRNPRQATEEDAKDDHGEKGLQNGPSCTQHRLLVANLDVAPGEEVEQFAVFPQVA